MTQSPIATQATHVITQDEARSWLADHGFDISDVSEATIRIGSSYGWAGADRVHQINAWLDITWYKRDGQGQRYTDHTEPDGVAIGTASIPLSSLPRLTPVDPRPDAA